MPYLACTLHITEGWDVALNRRLNTQKSYIFISQRLAGGLLSSVKSVNHFELLLIVMLLIFNDAGQLRQNILVSSSSCLLIR